MARALRVVIPGGWYHVTSRGQRREALFHQEVDRRRFLGLVSELPDRYGVEIHAYVLMDNHYHLLVRTPLGNLSHAIRWLNVTYGIRFNWAHRQCGPVFQGRFKGVLIEGREGVSEVARYVHLNPVRITGLGLGKADQRRAAVIGTEDPGRELVRRRLRVLRDWRWSSWRMYSGAEPSPAWLETGTILGGCGGRSVVEQRRALQDFTETPVRQGKLESPWERLIGGLVLGSAEFAQRVLPHGRVNREEQTAVRRLERQGRPEWTTLIRAAEAVLGRPWKTMVEAHGDWGRDGVMFVAVRFARYRLPEVVREIPGVRYGAAAQAVQRFAKSLESDSEKSRFVKRLRRQLSNE